MENLKAGDFIVSNLSNEKGQLRKIREVSPDERRVTTTEGKVYSIGFLENNFRMPTKIEKAYAESSINRGNVNYMHEAPLLKLPFKGWCPDPSKEVLMYINKTFGGEHPSAGGDNGIAWNNNSVWRIEGRSGNLEISSADIEKIMHSKTVVVDTSGSLLDSHECTLNRIGASDWQSVGRSNREDEFAQQEPIVLKRREKSKKLIIS